MVILRGYVYAYMVTGKGLSLENNLVFPVDIRTVEGRHQEVQVGRQCLHDSHLGRRAAHDRGDELRDAFVGVEPCREGRVIERLEVTLDTLCRPGREILVDTNPGPFRLETQRVSAQVHAFVTNFGSGLCRRSISATSPKLHLGSYGHREEGA